MKATLPDGTVLDGTIEEVTSAIRAIHGKAATSDSGLNGRTIEQHSAAVWTMKRAGALWNCLYGNQQKLVKFLLGKREGATTREIMKYLGMKKGSQLAGVRSCITRNARRETGYKEAEVIKWALGDNGKWRYQIVPDVHEMLKQFAEGQESS